MKNRKKRFTAILTAIILIATSIVPATVYAQVPMEQTDSTDAGLETETTFAIHENETVSSMPAPGAVANASAIETGSDTSPSETDSETSPIEADSDALPSEADSDTLPSETDSETLPSETDSDALPSEPDSDASAIETAALVSASEAGEFKANLAPIPYAAGDIEINEINFPNPAFRDHVKRLYDDSAPFDVLTADEITAVTYISVSWNNNVDDLTGIEHFTALTELDCSETPLKALDVSKNINLTKLYCSYTDINKLNLDANTKLRVLDCSNSPIDQLSISKNTMLTDLDCSGTNLTGTLDLSNSPNLTNLSCYDSQISELNISQNLKLRSLFCNQTNISRLDVSPFKDLEYLDCSETNIAQLNVTENSKLTYLYCHHLNIDNLDVRNNPELEQLLCHFTQIDTLNVEQNPKLFNLYCDNNPKLKDLNVRINTELISLHIQDTGITSIDLSQNTLLEDFMFSNFHSLDLTPHSNLYSLDCTGSPLAWLDINDNTIFEWLTLPTPEIPLVLDDLTFNISDKLWGIDPAKVTILSGGTLDPNTGIVSGYDFVNPIIYSYNCGGTFQGEPVTLTVTIRQSILIKDSSILINKDLNKTYDGVPVSLTDSDLTITGSDKAVSYSWFAKNGNVWEPVGGEPENAGIYKVTVKLEGNDFFGPAEASQDFEIRRAATTVTITKDLNKTYDGKAVQLSDSDLTVTGSSGARSFTWEVKDGSGWKSLNGAPADAGNYRVTAHVAEDMNYNAAVSKAEEFTILKATTTVKINKDLDKTDDGSSVSLSGSDVIISGSSGNVTYVWEEKDGSGWKALSAAPTSPGTYRVTVHVEGDKNHDAGSSLAAEFTIKKAEVPKDTTDSGSENPVKPPKKPVSSVQTGDTMPTVLLVVAAILSAGTIAIIITYKQRRKVKK